MEIIIGSAQNLSVIDLKQSIYTNQDYWNTYRGDAHRTGSYLLIGSDIISGDLNQDGIVDVLDLVMVINIIIGNLDPSSIQLISGDLNNDGTIDVLDVVQLVNTILDN